MAESRTRFRLFVDALICSLKEPQLLLWNLMRIGLNNKSSYKFCNEEVETPLHIVLKFKARHSLSFTTLETKNMLNFMKDALPLKSLWGTTMTSLGQSAAIFLDYRST